MFLTYEEEKAINEARSDSRRTKRPTVNAMEEILYDPFAVLDHGFVRVVDYMGDDAAVVQAARVSYGRGTTKPSDDRTLIRYLMRQRHSSPFEMCELKLHCKMPIFVARQWIRHRTANVNEISARYSILDREFYVPEPEHLGVQSSTNRQGRGDVIPADQASRVIDLLREDALRAYDRYRYLLNENDDGDPVEPERDGLARELARMDLTLNFYTQWYWKIDLHNLLHFLSLRMDKHAQYEIRVYGDAIGKIVAEWVPFTWEAFRDYRLEGVSFSRTEMEVVRELIARGRGDDASPLAPPGLSTREQKELRQKLGLES